MKKLLLIIILFSGLIACDKNETSIKPTTPTTSFVMTQGKWKVTNMNHNGNTEAHFTNYEFTFNVNGVLTAVKEGVTTNGYWSTRTENGEQKLNITFSSPPLNEMNFDWKIKQINVNNMNLYDGGTEYLDFQKL